MCNSSRPHEPLRSAQANLLASLLGVGLAAIPATGAVHSDIVISLAGGALQVDATIHTANVRENDAQGNGTIWATDNPGFAGSGFRFNDEVLFDLTGPLKRWNGTNWTTGNVVSEQMDFVEPGPFGDHLHAVTVGKDTPFAAGYRIAQIGTRGNLHTHFVFILRATDGLPPTVGAYSFPLTIRSPQYASAPPVHLVFNNGLTEPDFARAVAGLQARLTTRIAVEPTVPGAVALRIPNLEGLRYQPQSAPTATGPWTDWDDSFIGDGGERQLPAPTDGEARFFRVLQRP